MKLNVMMLAGLALIVLAFVAPVILATVTYDPVPTGQFYINDELATSTSTHIVDNPTLNFKFVANTHGDLIVNAVVSLRAEDGVTHVLWEGSIESWIRLTETIADTEWTDSGTLPDVGTYVIYGIIDTAGESITIMSIVGTWTGDTGTFSGQDISEVEISILQLGLGVAGAALVVLGLRKKRR